MHGHPQFIAHSLKLFNYISDILGTIISTTTEAANNLPTYLYDDHNVTEFTGHTVVGKPEQELETMSGEGTAKLCIHQMLQSAELSLYHPEANRVRHTHVRCLFVVHLIR